MSIKRVCLVTPGHIASSPRVVKEADALHEAGYATRVVAGDVTPAVRPLDASILAQARWRMDKVGFGPRPLHLARRLRQELAGKALSIGGICAAQWAQSPLTGNLARAAAAEPADLYVAHCVAALPAAAWAARRHAAKLGFDAEDDHIGELEDRPENRSEIEVRRRIEARYLPCCHHLTAASPGIARAYRERYGVKMTSILNVFPLAHAPRVGFVEPCASHGRLSVYWFSQTIGPGRGLEPFLKVMGELRGNVQLSVRGNDFLGYSNCLKKLAAEAGVIDSVKFLPPSPPDAMAQLAAHHDVGLALELGAPPNRAISLTNKIFTYLLAGIPVLLSDTPAQREIAVHLGKAARVVDLNAADTVLAALNDWATNAEALTIAKREASRLSWERFNWDIEKESFLRSVQQTLR
jgi:glycosyltransferase involved in cell wall biosynthesis